MIVLGILVVVVVALAIAVYALATKRAVKSFGEPTPEEARITQDSDDITKKIVVLSAQDKEAIANADRKTLLASLRALVAPKVRK